MIKAVQYYVVLTIVVMLGAGLMANTATAQPERIVSLSPNITEIVHILELDDAVVGVTEHCHIESLKKTKESIGTFFSPNVEKIVTLSPDLVIGLETQESVIQKLRTLLPGSTFLVVKNEPLQRMLESIVTIGEAMSRSKRAEQCVNELKGIMAAYREKAAKRRNSPGVLYVVSHSPGDLHQIYAAGERTFINELLEIVGARNVLAVDSPQYPIISREVIISLNPDIIIDTSISEDATTETITRTRALWVELRGVHAVRTNSVYVTGKQFITIPAPRSIEKSLHYLYKIISGKLTTVRE